MGHPVVTYVPGEERGDVLLDACAEETGVGQLAVPLDGAVLARLHPRYHAARLLRRYVVHRLLVPASVILSCPHVPFKESLSFLAISMSHVHCNGP